MTNSVFRWIHQEQGIFCIHSQGFDYRLQVQYNPKHNILQILALQDVDYTIDVLNIVESYRNILETIGLMNMPKPGRSYQSKVSSVLFSGYRDELSRTFDF